MYADSTTTIFDIAVKFYGSLDYVGKLIFENENISVDYSFSDNPNTSLAIDDSFVAAKPSSISSVAKSIPSVAAFSQVDGQSIFDVALMTYGSLDFIGKIIADNNFSVVQTRPKENGVVIFNPAQNKSGMVLQTIKKYGYNFATLHRSIVSVASIDRILENFTLRILENGTQRILE